MKALEAKVAQDGIVLTESQLAALEKAKSEKGEEDKKTVRGTVFPTNDGEFESECPGYCGAQDTCLMSAT